MTKGKDAKKAHIPRPHTYPHNGKERRESVAKVHTPPSHTYPHRGKGRRGGGDETGFTTLLYYIYCLTKPITSSYVLLI